MRRFILVCVAMMMLFCLTGCKDLSSVNDLALEYMENKYEKEFEYYGPYGSSMDGTRSFVATQEEFPDELIIVQVENYREDENDKIYRDNFLAVMYKQQTIDYITECADEVWGEANVYLEVGTLTQSANLDSKTTFEEFLLDTSAPLRFDVEISGGNFLDESQVDQFSDLISSSGAQIKSRIIVVEEDNYGGINRDSIDAKITEKKYLNLATLVITDGLYQIDWK